MIREENRIVFVWEDETFEFRDVKIDERIQDKGRTVKFFISKLDVKSEEKPKVVILDDNELSLSKYAEEYPENFEEIADAISESSEVKDD